MHSGSQHLFDIIILLSAAVFIVIAFWKMNISPVLGYFVAGALIGSHGFNLIHSAEVMDNFAEFGVVFLLFIIGLELTFERLIAMRMHVFGFGSLQVIVTMIAIWCIALAFGVSTNMAAIIGGGLALSSTAIVLQVLQEKGSQASQVGRLSVAVLLMQDFAVVPLIVLVPLLTGNSEHSLISSLTGSLVQAAIALVLIFVTGRLLLRPLFSVIAKMDSNEVFISTTLLIILGSAFITEQFHLSMALGAFVAGLLVAETEHRHSVEHAVLPFKDLFLGLFFMTVGMSIDIDLLLNKLPLVTLLSIILIVLKTSIIYTLCRFFGFRSAPAIQAGLLLAQGGEFAFILFRLADELDVLPSEIAQVLMMVTTVTMAFTPLLSGIGDWIANSFSTEKVILDDEAIETDTQDLYNHVIVAGFGRVGYMVTKMLTAEHLSYVVVDIQSKIVKEGKNDSFPIYLGDATRHEILKSVGIERAQALVVSIKNEVTIKKIVSLVAANFPHVNIIIRLPDLNNVEIYKDLGASKIIPETSEIGLQLGGAALSLSGISESGVTSLKGKFRKGNYSMLKDLDKDE
ncbi:glutathione-regulated potassium-efflux system protein [Wolbachia endosymbiont of Armadillidium vulgare str. wVulC]|uniref:monovalent cation:proton antiporter-2 (CPA2) family protein n=1 Tax=Wolbachia endosymbiont of Armadillidium vulgare TaxID=77039 RepID=UPI00064A7CCA|nr:monovalent cation:proton antiporter-2 (CPA2) family protein [Wolbachia endosymbiont of Armadillidium vulgare]KLT23019.1 glutathione-regulated potassium-efflux system protein [Wolbachia endosymbiont of Armadillidium vulgare str. wVulC]OJH30420.1 Glutathione-regulated potassium-efflux system protein KefC [Armadillidium vulgare] [Wolbachia endosymbiont of Armadillidium vulgare]OJH31205.1 Glutathione-regulated potassium-efflux system protein KefC [Wolbachia endosymbiont of Armadillidium vulgare]